MGCWNFASFFVLACFAAKSSHALSRLPSSARHTIYTLKSGANRSKCISVMVSYGLTTALPSEEWREQIVHRKWMKTTRTHTTRSAAHLQFHAFIEMLIRARNDTTTNQSLHGQRVMWWRINAIGAFARTRETFHVLLSSHLRRNKVIYKWCLTLESWTLQLNANTEWSDEKKNWFSASKDIFMINDKSSTCVRINGDGRHQNRTISFLRLAWLFYHFGWTTSCHVVGSTAI